jgi:predicted nuclease of predicted toxin-antitoxin system
MAVSFYFDEMMSRKAAEQLVQRGHSVVMAQDVGMQQKTDVEHLAYAAENKLVLVTFDRAFADELLTRIIIRDSFVYRVLKTQ